MLPASSIPHACLQVRAKIGLQLTSSHSCVFHDCTFSAQRCIQGSRSLSPPALDSPCQTLLQICHDHNQNEYRVQRAQRRSVWKDGQQQARPLARLPLPLEHGHSACACVGLVSVHVLVPFARLLRGPAGSLSRKGTAVSECFLRPSAVRRAEAKRSTPYTKMRSLSSFLLARPLHAAGCPQRTHTQVNHESSGRSPRMLGLVGPG